MKAPGLGWERTQDAKEEGRACRGPCCSVVRGLEGLREVGNPILPEAGRPWVAGPKGTPQECGSGATG